MGEMIMRMSDGREIVFGTEPDTFTPHLMVMCDKCEKKKPVGHGQHIYNDARELVMWFCSLCRSDTK